MSLKYISFEGQFCDEIVIFSDTIEHKQMAIRMGCMDRLLGAGFAAINDAPTCWGRSTSLDLKCRPELDTALLRRFSGYDY